jgi:hypothetical protein
MQSLRRRPVTQEFMESGKRVQDDALVEPQEVRRQGQLPAKGREQGQPLVRIPSEVITSNQASQISRTAATIAVEATI